MMEDLGQADASGSSQIGQRRIKLLSTKDESREGGH